MNTRVKFTILFGALLALSAPTPALACSCAWMGSFVKMAKSATIVAQGKVVAHDKEKPERPLYMDFQISEVLSGSYSPGPIRIWGDNGFQCRPSIKNFPIGTEWVLAISGPEGQPSAKGDYFISNCGEYWLVRQGAYVHGNVSGATRGFKQSVPLVEFRRMLKAKIK